MPRRIDQLTRVQRDLMAPWARQWIQKGWRTGEADWATFERAAQACYGYAGIPWPGVVVRVQNPLVGALAAPIADHLIHQLRHRDAVDGTVRGAVRGAVHVAVAGAVGSGWYRRLGGQWWLAWQAWTSYFRDICHLELDGDLWDRDRAYADAQTSVGWWWPYRDFVIVCNRPTILHLEQIRPAGWGSHRLHCDDGPAVAWPDGYALWFLHGVRVTRQLVEAPHTLTSTQISGEPNQEIRRLMVDRYGPDRYLQAAGGTKVATDDWGVLWRLNQPDDEPLLMVEVINATPEPDGEWKTYWLRVDPRCRPMLPNGRFGPPQPLSPRNAVASTFGLTGEEYADALTQQT